MGMMDGVAIQSYIPTLAIGASLLLPGCGAEFPSSATQGFDHTGRETTIQQIIPQNRLDRIIAALPEVASPTLQDILDSEETLWYDREAMAPSYQDSVGAQTNATWPDLVAASSSVINGLHDSVKERWQFPFSTTAGTDQATNLVKVNFLHLPHVDGRPLSIPIWTVRRNYNRPQWMWVYPNDTTVGEILFVADGANILPAEIRTRRRHPGGWSTNVFRPFPTAASLADAIKMRRPDWSSQTHLRSFVNHLNDTDTLTAKTLAGRAALATVFRQDGALDILPDIHDPALIRELLTSTKFVSSFGKFWKDNGTMKTFAASTRSALSIVPTNYEAGVLEVNDESCMRCHQDAGGLVSEYYDALYLYGEVWGKDGIFSFHPYDESLFPRLRFTGNDVDGYFDNREMNPKLRAMGVIAEYNAGKHRPPLYPEKPDPR